MKDPLRLYMWMLGQDVNRGALHERGFASAPHEQGSRLYRRGPLGLHSLGIWLDLGPEWLVYQRERGQFFRVPAGTLPPSLVGAQRVRFTEGWEQLLPQVQEHERWVAARYGSDYRQRLLRIVPPRIRPYRRAWKNAFTPTPGTDPKDAPSPSRPLSPTPDESAGRGLASPSPAQ